MGARARQGDRGKGEGKTSLMRLGAFEYFDITNRSK